MSDQPEAVSDSPSLLKQGFIQNVQRGYSTHTEAIIFSISRSCILRHS